MATLCPDYCFKTNRLVNNSNLNLTIFTATTVWEPSFESLFHCQKKITIFGLSFNNGVRL